MCTTRLCFNALRSLKLFRLWNKRDAVFMTSEAAPLPSRPFNHLSVLAYLAIGIVLFASSVVTGYLIHSCYRSATREKSPTTRIVDAESGMMYRRTGRRYRDAEVELKPLAREFCHDDESFLSDSRTVIGKRSDPSFDKHVVVSPLRLEYSSDDTAASPLFRMPSPSSPSPAHQKKIHEYPGPISYSPVALAPSFFRHGSPPSTYAEGDRYGEQQSITFNAKAKPHSALRPGTQFDSNNIRYIPRLEPCVAESTVKLYKEPKLSPVLGSIVPPSPGDRLLCPSLGRQPSFSQDIRVVLTNPSSTNSTPISTPQKRARLIYGETSPPIVRPRLPESCHKDSNINPIWQQHSPILPTVRLKPGPGYF